MPDVDGQIVLGLDIAKTTEQMDQDLNRVLTNIGKKEITLSARLIIFGVSKSLRRLITLPSNLISL